MKSFGLAVLIILVASQWACGGGSSTGDNNQPRLDILNVEDLVPVDSGTKPDLTTLEVDLGSEDGRSEFDLNDECGIPGACFMDPCEKPADCVNKLCVAHLGDRICSIPCVSECPQGFECQQVSLGGPDLVFACVSQAAVLCRPCKSSEDCVTEGRNDVCVDFGPNGDFCGGECSEEIACPDGYECREVSSVEGVESKQCMPADDVCGCSATSIKLGLSTSCQVSSDFGTCSGIRMCTQDGLADCSAAEPVEESCNGLDDDCNGVVDDMMCDDQNPCTDDSCAGEEGCRFLPNTVYCDDGDPCTEGDHCDTGSCVGGWDMDCDDTNPCTLDSCQDGACVHENADGGCNDGDPCTTSDHCEEGVCVGDPTVSCDDGNECTTDACIPGEGCKYTQLSEGTCDDNNPCTTGEHCVTGECTDGSSTNCNDANPCTDDSCDTQVGCVNTFNESPCNDGNACTTGEACLEGACQGGNPLPCDDSNPCTSDSCDPAAGCQYNPNTEPCSDQDVCTLGDVCLDGGCIPGEELGCDDGNPCTDDGCDPVQGCIHLNNSAECNDNNACTVSDACVAGQCQGSGSLDCDDGNQCTNDICLPEGGCSHVNTQVSCSDGDPCTLNDVCFEGACVSGEERSCDDKNECTEDFCDETGLCQNVPMEGDCDDGNDCTRVDTCLDGVCTGSDNLVCNDSNPCTMDWCDPNSGCVFQAVDIPCSDGNECTVGDQCSGGTCVPGVTRICFDGNICTDDTCDPEGGCLFAGKVGPCNDGNSCTLGDKCIAGECSSGVPITCDDGNPCTNDSCDQTYGCTYSYNQLPCDDNNDCTDGDVCSSGQCRGVSAVDCNDGNPCTTDSCLPDGGCAHQEYPGACSDGDPCTVNDYCQLGECVSGKALGCDDGNPCTLDYCQSGVCVNDPSDSACNDGNACTTGDYCSEGRCQAQEVLDCDDENSCTTDWCSAALGCLHQNNAQPCSDGNTCTVGDTCGNGQCIPGSNLNCNDGNLCTNDSCDPNSGCLHVNNTKLCTDHDICTTGDICTGGECVAQGVLDCEDDNACTTDSCDPESGCIRTFNTLPCDDGNACTTGETCLGGACTAAGYLDCADGNPCTNDSCNPSTGCVFTNNTISCNDGDPCTLGDTCQGGQCMGSGSLNCDDSNPCTDDSCVKETGCVHVNNQLPCDDNNSCTEDDFCTAGACRGTGSTACDDNNPCTRDICLPGGGCSHENAPGICSDGDSCTTADTCQAGVCVGGPALSCNDSNPCTDDYCTNGQCLHVANTQACDDNNICTLTDTCVGGICQGIQLSCDDGDLCTSDYCDPDQGCLNVFNTNPCNDGNPCTTADLCQNGTCQGTLPIVCDDGNSCTNDSCDPAIGCVFAPNNLECDDGNVCTTGDRCLAGICNHTGTLACSDANPCTDDFCDPSVGCLHSANSLSCNDGNLCTQNDTCTQGTCKGQTGLTCNDQNECTTDQCNQVDGCIYTPVPDFTPCGDGSWACGGGVCMPCVPNCASKDCGDDGCGGSCGVCLESESCIENGLCVPGGVFHGEFYKHVVPSDQSCIDWNNFRASLFEEYTSVSLKGYMDPVGYTCTGAVANDICHALYQGATGAWDCGGVTWRVGSCTGSIELSTNGALCSCNQTGGAVRPCVPNWNWGGMGGKTCNSVSQSIDVICL